MDVNITDAIVKMAGYKMPVIVINEVVACFERYTKNVVKSEIDEYMRKMQTMPAGNVKKD